MFFQIKMSNGGVLKEAGGDNSNTFYYTATVPKLKQTCLYDINTQPEKIYLFIVK